MKVFIIFFSFFFSFSSIGKVCDKFGSCWNIGERALSNPVCNSSGKCWTLKTFNKMKTSYCKSIGKNKNEIQELNNKLSNSEGFGLKENFDLINCYKHASPLNISQTIIMRDMWPGHLTPHLCFASENTNKRDLVWVKNGIKKRRFHWKKYLKTYEFALKNKTEFNQYCGGRPPYNGNIRFR